MDIQEIRYQVGEAWKGTYNAATVYGNAAVVQDPTGLSVYRSLKSGNTGHPLTDQQWWFRIIDMSSIKSEADHLIEIDTEMTEHEAARVSAENQRISHENARINAENARINAENARANAESARVQAEQNRVTQENLRINQEQARMGAEQQRVTREQQRVSQEASRVTAETQRQLNENDRQAVFAEDHAVAVADHQQAEQDHTRAESDHETAVSDHGQMTDLVERADADHVQAGNDHTRAESDHTTAASDHTQAGSDHTRAGQDHVTASDDHTQAGNDHTRAGEDHAQAVTDHEQYEIDHASIADKVSHSELENAIEPLAQKNGFYTGLTSGNALNLLSEDEVTEQSTMSVTAPNYEIGNGTARVQEIMGDTVVWNQLYKTNGLVTEQEQLADLATRIFERFTTAEKTTPMGAYFVREWLSGADLSEREALSGEGFIPALTEENGTNYTGLHYKVKATHADVVSDNGSEASPRYTSAFFISGSTKRNVIDLALIFGMENSSTYGFRIYNAPTTLAQMYGWLVQKIGLSDSYDYCKGTLMSVTKVYTGSVRGANLLDPQTGIAVLPYYTWTGADGLYKIAARTGTTISSVQVTSLATGVTETLNAEANAIAVEENDVCVVEVSVSAGSLSNVVVWAVWDDATELEDVGAYDRDVLELDLTRVVGQENGTGDFVRVFKDGMRRDWLDVRDSLDLIDSACDVRIGTMKMRSLTFSRSTENVFSSTVPNGKCTSGAGRSSVLCDLYSTYRSRSTNSESKTLPICICSTRTAASTSKINITDYRYDTLEAFAAMLSVEDPSIFYELDDTYKRHYTNLYLIPADAEGDIFTALPEGSQPLKEAFSGIFQVGNLGTEQQMTNWDAQGKRFNPEPVSVAPVVTSVMPGNAAELVRSLTQMDILEGWVSPAENKANFDALCAALVSSGIATSATASSSDGGKTITFDITQ